MRIFKGYIGCWLGLAVSFILFVYVPAGLEHLQLDSLLVFTGTIAFVPTIIIGVFERSSWRPPHYAILGAVMAATALAAIAIGAVYKPLPANAQEWLECAIAFGCAIVAGITTGGTYRLFAGAKAS